MKKFFIFIILSFLSLSIWGVMLVDDFENDDKKNLLNGNYEIYHDEYSSVSIKEINNNNSKVLYMKWEIKEGVQYPFAGFSSFLDKSNKEINLKGYKGIRFKAKGKGELRILMASTKTDREYNHYLYLISLTENWKLYEIDFKNMIQGWGTPIEQSYDIYAIQWTAFDPNITPKGYIYLDDVEFYKDNEKTENSNLLSDLTFNIPKVNQIGYLINQQKYFTITSSKVKKGDTFKILNKKNEVVYKNKINSNPVNDTASSGENVYIAEFSDLNTPGEYHIVINNLKSADFKISNDVYNNFFKDVLRAYYIIRCGVKLNDKVTGISHKACHTNDKITEDNKANNRDFTGGWHNAGDFGKWTHMKGMSIANMLWLYELKKSEMINLKVNIPESSNDLSDLLDEAKWGLTWLFKMQNKDGSVYHKVDTDPYFSIGKAPENDKHKRYVRYGAPGTTKPSTIDASHFTAVMCQAYRVFLDIDKDYADKCKKAAIKTMKWIETNPKRAQDDFWYKDPEYKEELLWAYAEFYRLTGEKKYLNKFINLSNSIPPIYPSWMSPQIFGYFTLCLDNNINDSFKNKLKSQIKTVAETYINQINKSGYSVPLLPKEYYWGSNQEVAGKGSLLLFYSIITKDKKYEEYALKCLHYLLGNNSLNKSFVTGYGQNPVTQPYNWTYLAYKKIFPGWLTGGPNQYPTLADYYLKKLMSKGTPPAKCYADMANYSGSWASNEGATDHQASLLFLVGYFTSSRL